MRFSSGIDQPFIHSFILRRHLNLNINFARTCDVTSDCYQNKFCPYIMSSNNY